MSYPGSPPNAAESPPLPPPAAQAGGRVQSLTRGLKLLEWISESHSSVALAELARGQAGLPNSTTHRLLTTMQQLGSVRQVGDFCRALGDWRAVAFLSSAAPSCKAAICWPSSILFCAN